jgi:hypothetical protein
MSSAGDVFDYPYLWKREQLNHETEGRKPRPCACVAAVIDQAGQVNMFILAITGSYGGNGKAIEIPAVEKRRAGLDSFKQLWVVIDEYNHDILGKSFYFEPSQKRGALSPAFTKSIFNSFKALAVTKSVSSVRRNT